MTTLNLTLIGLCGLVPNEFVPETPELDPFPVTAMRILVLDAAVLGAQLGVTLCPHQPQIIVGTGNNVQTFNLNQHTITIDGLAAGGTVELRPEYWEVARVNQVTANPVNVDDRFLSDLRGIGLVASLRIRTGEAKGIDPAEQELNFQNNPPYKKNFARKVHLALPLSGPGKLHFTPFGETTVEHSIDLVPNDGSVEVTLTNICDPAPEGNDRQGADFVAFYGLLSTYRGPRFLPMVVPTSHLRGEIRGEASGGGSGCVPCTYNDHPDA
jgi:hypothetical protein